MLALSHYATSYSMVLVTVVVWYILLLKKDWELYMYNGEKVGPDPFSSSVGQSLMWLFLQVGRPGLIAIWLPTVLQY
jgi:hypothetical protein